MIEESSLGADLPRKGVVFGLLLKVVVGAVMGLGLADFAAGHYDAARDLRRSGALMLDAELAWAPRPDFVFKNGITRVNSLGLRGPEIPSDAPPTELRILGMGASRTFGSGVAENEKIWSNVLEKLLNFEGIESRVFNGGVNGYSNVQSSRRAIRLTPVLQPDLILLFTSPGAQMLLDETIAGQWAEVGGEPVPRDIVDAVPGLLKPVAARLHRLLLNSSLYARYRARIQADGNRPPGLRRYVYNDRQAPLGGEDMLDTTWREIEALVEHCRAEQIELRAVLMPLAHQTTDKAWVRWIRSARGKGVPPLDMPRREPTAALEAQLKRLGLEVWLLQDELEQIGNDTDRFTFDTRHWTPPGHRIVGTSLLQHLLAETELLERMTAHRQQHPRD
ncbi:MAG: hypothetical protein DRQ55_06665 [Planctomycetota bacterium]|nr:MAG: hypothetical protein DRQ55_06665 [Planctomycetota bacterium]